MSDEAGLQKLKVAELRSKLEEKGLDSKGTKPTLVARLMGVLDPENNKVDVSSVLTPVKQRQSRRTSAVGGGAKEDEGTPAKKSRRLSGALGVAEERPMTPTRQSRRLSVDVGAEERPMTPTRQSRRISEVVGVEERPMTPTRQSRRLSVDVGAEERPMTPTRQTRRLSEALGGDERPLTPTRQSRRLSGAGLEDLVGGSRPGTPIRGGGGLEEQLDAVESARKRTVARSKRLSGLGGIVSKPIMEAETIEEEAEMEDSQPEGNNDQVKSAIIEESIKSTPNTEAEKEQDIVEESTESVSETKEAASELNISKEKDARVVVEEETVAITSGGDSKSNDVEMVDSVAEEITTVSQDSAKNVTHLDAKKPLIETKVIPRQKPKSGKFWKGERGQFRQIKKDRGQRLTFDQRLKLKEEKSRNKELAAHLLGIKSQKKEEMRLKIEENKKKKLENERKSEQFQIIKNPAKIKRMKKKQLRMLEKRDTLAQKQ